MSYIYVDTCMYIQTDMHNVQFFTLELPGTNKTKEKEAADETGGNKTSEENTSDGQPAEQQAPPSQMSANSSSSSPSRIFATDMKSKKKRDRPLDDKSLDVKRKRLGIFLFLRQERNQGSLFLRYNKKKKKILYISLTQIGQRFQVRCRR